MCRLPDRKCVDHIVRCNPQALIYCQRGKQVGPRCWAQGAGESWPAAESPTFSTTGAGGCRPARYLSWIPWIPWNASSNHGGASEFPLGSTYLLTYLSINLPFYQPTYMTTSAGFRRYITPRATTATAQKGGVCATPYKYSSSRPCNRRCRRLMWSLILKHVRDG